MFYESIHATNEKQFSSGVMLGDFLFVSAQLPLNEEGKVVLDSIESMTELCLQNVDRILNEKDIDLTYVLRMNIYLTDMSYYDMVKSVLNKCFPESKPAVSFIGVNALPYFSPIQIDAYAIDTRSLELLCSSEDDYDVCEGNVCTCGKVDL